MTTGSDSDFTTVSPSPKNGKGVGLSDPQLSQTRRRMLDLVNRLVNTGIQTDIDLPLIAVIGSQSVGKSSLIEAISGITLPRSSGTCTRCPTECRLTFSKERWSCKISLRFLKDENGQTLSPARIVPFGDVIYDKEEVEDRLRRAQRAILHPSVMPRNFLDDEPDEEEGKGLTFSTNCITLQITGNDVADLSFVDLPGLIATVATGGDKHDIELIKELANQYVHKGSCIILLAVSCETDFENQGAHTLAREADPEGKRTIGVLTKPDRIPEGEEQNWIRYVRNDREPLENGWYSVKLPNSKELASGIAWDEARQKEQDFFSMTRPWSGLELFYQKRLGVQNLTDRLSEILSRLIARRLPEIQNELQDIIERTENDLRSLPKPPSNDPFSEMLHVIQDFAAEVKHHVDGTPDENGLLQKIIPTREEFRKAIRATAPDFRTCERHTSTGNTAQRAPEATFLLNEEDIGEQSLVDNTKAIYIDDVMKRAREAVTRELPNNFPFVVKRELIKDFTKKWGEPARQLFDSIQRIILDHIRDLVHAQFRQYAEGGLPHRVMVLLQDHIKRHSEVTLERIKWLLELEQDPFTLNTLYYADYKDKFLALYKGFRRDKQSDVSLITRLQDHESGNTNHKDTFTSEVNNALASLSKVGLSGARATDLPKLLPPDPLEAALEIMAEVRAYFQLAYKRIVDNIPLAIDRELVRGLHEDLWNSLFKGLGLNTSESQRICQEFVQEPSSVSAMREDLRKKLDRLESAKGELLASYMT